ncbi:GerMN domain-containing protein [Haloimpatiens sp. FM7330]|uniref:GerMN domain-containing protein n=1 Tax=Haloimpatiens sp. FM7330 TaxID=3298610 RepID=UPI003643A3DA
MSKKLSVFLIMLCFTATLVFVGCEQKDKISTVNKEKVENIQISNKEKDDFVNIEVFFPSSKGKDNLEIAKEPRIINKEELIGETIVHELMKGPSPQSQLKPILGKNVKLLSFSIKEGIAYINFSKEAKQSMTKSEELVWLKSVVCSVTDLHSVDKVKILIENQNIDSIGGNYDISKPVGKQDLQLFK